MRAEATTEQERAALVEELEGRRVRATVAADVPALAELLADDCRYVHSSGVIDTKESYLANLASGVLVYDWIEPHERVVLDLGTAVAVSHVMRAHMVVYGAPRDYAGQAVAVWRLDGERPQLALFQATALPAPSPS